MVNPSDSWSGQDSQALGDLAPLRLPSSALSVLAALSSFGTKKVQISQAELAQMVGLSDRGVRRAIAQLRQAGLVMTLISAGKTSTYLIRRPYPYSLGTKPHSQSTPSPSASVQLRRGPAKVLAALAMVSQDGIATISQPQLAHIVGLSEKQVRRHLRFLCQAGLVVSFSFPGQTSTYLIPCLVSEQQHP